MLKNETKLYQTAAFTSYNPAKFNCENTSMQLSYRKAVDKFLCQVVKITLG
jgi:hypothetical protein